MKRRKFKLFASMASLVMVVAVMAVGVWAASTLTLNVTTNVTFTATGFNGILNATAKRNGADANLAVFNGGNPLELAASSTTAGTYNLPTFDFSNATTGGADFLLFTFNLTSLEIATGKHLDFVPALTTPAGWTQTGTDTGIWKNTGNTIQVTFVGAENVTTTTAEATIKVEYIGELTTTLTGTDLGFTLTMKIA